MNIEQLQQDLQEIYHQSSVRGLRQSVKWAAEMLMSLKSQKEIQSSCLYHTDQDSTFEPPIENKNFSLNNLNSDYNYLFAKSVFDLEEYERAAYFTQNCDSNESRFLHFYSKYLAIEKERLDKMVDPRAVVPEYSLKIFNELKKVIENLLDNNECCSTDAYLYYLYGIILLKLGLNNDAISSLSKSIFLDPLCWCSWNQLSQIIEDESQFAKLQLPNHWLKNFFLAAVHLELQSHENALFYYEDLLKTFTDNNYIKTQIAILKHSLRDLDRAIETFTSIRSTDPYRLDAMDIYSNLLYVREMHTELSSLAHVANQIDPFRVETCFCIANFYSLRGQHAKSVVYFSRALQLNPKHLSAWTLMGHEYVELKNTNAAIQAYRSAIKCSKRDYRAWYGLGQTYEILKLPSYSLYYYSNAHFLKPSDTRLILALGQTYEKMNRNEEAANCYAKAGFPSLIRLANLYVKLNEEDKAAAVYNEFVNHFEENKTVYQLSLSDLTIAYKYLANYFLKHKKYEQAQVAAQMCMYFNEARDEGKELLNKIQIILQKPT